LLTNILFKNKNYRIFAVTVHRALEKTMKAVALIKENIRVSFGSIRSNMLRSILTMLIIAVGIMALIGILTAIDSIKSTITTQFATMGANTFSIESRSFFVQNDKERKRKKNNPYISYRQAKEFKERFSFPATVSISTFASNTAVVKFKSEKTHPNIAVIGADENYLLTAGYEIEKGRNISFQDVQMNRNVVILGSALAKKLFKNGEDPLNKDVNIGNGKFITIGVLKEKGSSFSSSDNMCILTYTSVRQYFSWPNRNYSINVVPASELLSEAAIGYSEGLFRSVRRLKVIDESDFEIIKSDFLSNLLKDILSYVLIAATVIGIVTLCGAAIGLMNIMLVSVTERTTEIGIRKAIGAKNTVIRQQFLFEAILICQLGGFAGILLGVLVGKILSQLFGSHFVMPWFWIFSGIILCSLVGLVSGYYPAAKASKLDPIVALRYE
jgi:putative ABC transport system permease protein